MIVVDTGPLVAMANEQDRHHIRCVEWFDVAPRPLLVPAPVLTEVCYLLERERGSSVEAAFLRSVRDDVFTLVSLAYADLDRMAELVEAYASLPLGAADASVVAVAERLKVTDVGLLIDGISPSSDQATQTRSRSCRSPPTVGVGHARGTCVARNGYALSRAKCGARNASP